MASQIQRACPFNNSPEFPCGGEQIDYFAMRETCDAGEYGMKCGPILVQQALIDTLDVTDLSSTLDKRFGLIDAGATVERAPFGDLPPETHAATVGLEFPLRSERITDDSEGIYVTHGDLILTLLRRQRMAAANAYNRHRYNAQVAGTDVEWWRFGADEVRVQERSEPAATIDYYDDSFNLRSPVVWNGATTYFGLARLANVDYRPSVIALRSNGTDGNVTADPFDNAPIRRQRAIDDVHLPE